MTVSGPLSGKKGVVATIMGIKLTAAVLAAPSGSGVSAHSGSPHKTLLPDRWYQRVEDSGSYVTWMTLTTDRHVPSGWEGTWGAPISNALAAYNDSGGVGGTHTVYFQQIAHSDENDVHVAVTDQYFSLWGMLFPTYGALGITYLLDEAFHDCGPGDCDADHSRPNTWWYNVTLMDNEAHTGFYGNAWQRQATVAHELAHAIGLDEEVHNGVCAVPKSITDYDCLDGEVINTPMGFDSCGINHKYYDPNWGYAGC